MATYSFLSVQASITGPGGAISIGNSAGPSEEGISIEMLEEKDLMTVGADGSVMHSLRASNAVRISVRLLKTAPANALLSAMYNFQKSSPINWGANTLVVSDTARGDVVAAAQAAFARQPNVSYGKDGGFNEWMFYGTVDILLGAGVPDVNT